MTQADENREKLKEEFSKLLTDIQRSTNCNRDRFTQKLTVF